MTRRVAHHQLLTSEEIVGTPTLSSPRACEDRTFELPPILHVATAMLFVAFVSILCLAFATPGLGVPYAIFVFFIAAFFGVPALWARMKPDENFSHALRWSELMERGIMTATGRTRGGEAAILVLLLPTFVMLWAVAIAVIARTVH